MRAAGFDGILKRGNILVACNTDNYMLNHISGVAGIITEQAGLTSHAAIVGREKIYL